MGTVSLASLDQGFRRDYLNYAALTAQLQGWAAAYPEVVRLQTLGQTPEGRELWLLTIGREPDRIRPAVWIDGNMHASELCGSSVALGIAEEVIRLHVAPSDTGVAQTLSPALRARVGEVLFYVMPRMSPDGAEAVMQTGKYVRSAPRDDRPARGIARWRCGDVDGDGLALVMRVRDAGGEFVEASEVPGLMVPRTIDDEGPFYKIYPEGYIDNFDGHTIPEPHFLSDNETDLNRNFPWTWMPEPKQEGAGAFPLSEPESRAVVEFTSKHPEIFAWLNLHTFGGVFIRPLGDAPDSKMNPRDLAIFRQIGAWATELTTYPMVSGFEEFTYEPDKPLHGDLTDYAYHQRGALGYVCELWDLFAQVGLPRQKRFVDNYTHISRADMIRIAEWDRDQNGGEVIRPWRPAHHNQLGTVEVGGIDPRFGLWNPPRDRLDGICRQQAQAFLRVAAMAPALRIAKVERAPMSLELTRVTVVVENHGYLPSYVLDSAKDAPFAEPVHIDVAAHGCELTDRRQAHRQLGHLDGWGKGLFDGSGALYFTRSSGNAHSAAITYVVRGRGELRLRVGACRVGWIDHTVVIG